METYADIIRLWMPPPGTSTRPSWLVIFAAEVSEHIAPARVTYQAARRWLERDNIESRYWAAVVAAAKKRGYKDVTLDALSRIAAQRFIEAHREKVAL